MEMNSTQVEAIVKQVLNQLSGSNVSAGSTACSSSCGQGIPKTAHVAMLTSLENFEIKEFPMPEVGDDDILVKVDRTAMAVSLETRVPMLDKDVVEFAWTIPMEYKKKDGEGKLVLKDVLYRYVPKEMMDRPKKGFSIPIMKWLKEPELRAWAEALIDRKTLEQQGVLNPDVVWRIWKDYIENDNWRIQIWYILMFQSWMCEIYHK